MVEMGPAVRGLIDSAAAVAMARDPIEATLLLKRLAPGLPLVELAPPHARDELEVLMTAVRRRTETAFLAWAAKRDIPVAEIRAGLESYERCSAAELAGVLHELTPAETPRATLENALKETAERCGVAHTDIVARDIGRALVKAALEAAETYAEPLRDLAPPPLRP